MIWAKAEWGRYWAWDAKEDKDKRSFRIVQSSPSFVWPEAKNAAYRKWLVAFGASLTGLELDFWYDQFLRWSRHHFG
jgi:hypothetical protein